MSPSGATLQPATVCKSLSPKMFWLFEVVRIFKYTLDSFVNSCNKIIILLGLQWRFIASVH